MPYVSHALFYGGMLALTMLMFLTATIVQSKCYRSMVLYLGAFSILSTFVYVVLGALDVAITEAAIGACLTGVLMLKTGEIVDLKVRDVAPLPKVLKVLVFAVYCLFPVYFVLHFPSFGSKDSLVVSGVVQDFYIAATATLMKFPNVVTAVLGSIRGYDTFGEALVVFTASVAVWVILREVRHEKA